MPINENLFIAEAGLRTPQLQQALDDCAVRGVRLVLGPGVHSCGGLRLPSGTDLHLADDAVLRFLPDYQAYRDNRVGVIAEDSDAAMMLADGATNIRIGGRGLILGPGPDFITGRLDDMGTHIPAALRPRVLVLKECEGVTLEDFRIHSSPMWTIHLIDCRNVTAERLSIDNDREMPNTDGIVIDSCDGVVIRHCTIATADDGIVLKTSVGSDGSPVGACRNIVVEHCEVESRSCALKIGTETHGDVENIRFSDCVLPRSNRGIGLFSRDGGLIRNVEARRIVVDTHETPDGFWGSGEAVTVNVVDRRAGKSAGRIENIVFEDISGSMQGAINLVADSPSGIANVRLNRIGIAQVDGPHKGHSYDVRPTHFDLAPSPDAAGRANAWVKDDDGKVIGLVAYPTGMPALFASNIENLSLEDVDFSRPSPLPAGWSAEAITILQGEPVVWSAQ